MAAHAVSLKASAGRPRDQQSPWLLARLQGCALPPRALVPGLPMLWRRLAALPSLDDQLRVREKLEPWRKLLWIGSTRGSEGMSLY
jgi:hypothetical protein